MTLKNATACEVQGDAVSAPDVSSVQRVSGATRAEEVPGGTATPTRVPEAEAGAAGGVQQPEGVARDVD